MGRKNKSRKHSLQKKKKVALEQTTNVGDENIQEEPAGDKVQEKSFKYTVDQLLDKAEECIDEFNYEVAQKFCQRALTMDADHLRALETSGTLCIEMGQLDAAKHCFGRSVELNPDQGYSKYMYLGQIMTGSEAVQCFQKGIQLMIKEHEKQQEQEVASACASGDSKVTPSTISNAYCSVAELYMTDCCDEDDAEVKCKENIELAIKTDPESSEAYQLMASFLLLTEDKKGAKEMINKSISLWLPQYREAVEKSEGAEIGGVLQLSSLSYQSRVNASKILIEVEEYETASDILELLLDEDDTITQVWYLLGWLNNLQGDDYKGNARFYLHKAVKVAAKSVEEDPDMLAHIQQLLAELGPGEGDEDDDKMVDGEEVDIKSESEDEEMEH